MPPQAPRSRATSPEVETNLIPATVPSFRMANSIVTLPFFISGRPRRFRNQVVPIHSHIVQHALQIGAEIHAHGVGEDLQRSHGRSRLSAQTEAVISAVTAVSSAIRRRGASGLIDG